MNARDDILHRIQAAIGNDRRDIPVPTNYRTQAPDNTDIVELFAERAADYRAQVRRVDRDIAAEVRQVVQELEITSIAIPTGFPEHYLTGLEADLKRDNLPLSTADLDRTQAVITECAAAIAETGTIILGAEQGRRALTLLPDTHLCIVHTDRIVGTVPEAPAVPTPATWISGPSATSDIELHRVEGVHGPRTLVVLLTAVHRGP
ncbi:LutC/YkgG family protein [Actinokineospora cianjurensis]|uniref:L-lactate dehydrogenase complex protein LldG n=1 Tax=Actinokineospora cianjurensis TaxID=585224 RepID=A0A421AVJ1_9PSEU|nr:LUD domain-containing protein [Actinokineospora cianjurensis]RLK54081.1 L-lactate dehydrogenase complex protein LldG [Actinokineospora cianjurensis]